RAVSGSSASTSRANAGRRSAARSGTETSSPSTGTGADMADLRFRDLTKAFPGGTMAVESLDIEIADGEFMVFVGPSGSGKTTVLRLTAGLEEVTRGDISI